MGGFCFRFWFFCSFSLGGGMSLGFFGAILAGYVQNGSLAQRKARASSLGRYQRELPGLQGSSGRSGQRPEAARVLLHPGRPRGLGRPSFLCTHTREKTTRGCGRPDGTGMGGGAGAALAMVLHRRPAPPHPRTFRARPRVARPRCPLPLRVTPVPGRAGGLGRARSPGRP